MLYLKAVSAVAISIAAIAVTTGAYADNTSDKPETPKVTLCDGHDHLHTAQHHWKWAKKLVRGYSIPKWAEQKHRHHVQCPAGPNHKKVMTKR